MRINSHKNSSTMKTVRCDASKGPTSSQTMELSQNENYEVTDKEFEIWIGKKLNEMKENI